MFTSHDALVFAPHIMEAALVLRCSRRCAAAWTAGVAVDSRRWWAASEAGGVDAPMSDFDAPMSDFFRRTEVSPRIANLALMSSSAATTPNAGAASETLAASDGFGLNLLAFQSGEALFRFDADATVECRRSKKLVRCSGAALPDLGLSLLPPWSGEALPRSDADAIPDK